MAWWLAVLLCCLPGALVQYRDSSRAYAGPELVRQSDSRQAGGRKQYEETPRDEVERLLREYKQNQELVRRLGSRYYQVVYPIQVRHREKLGISTREIDSRNPQGSTDGRGVNELNPSRGGGSPRNQKHYRQTSLLIKAFQHKFRLDLELNTRLIAPNVQKKVFLAGGATATSTSASQDVEQCYYHGVVKDWTGGEFIPGSMAALQTCNGVSGIIHLGNETFVIHPFYGGDLSSKHPHIIYESNERPRQLCGVLDNQIQMRMRRSEGSSVNSLPEEEDDKRHHDHDHEGHDHVHEEPELGFSPLHFPHVAANRSRRDVRYVPKFIETALVLDKAMFENRAGLSRRDVIHEAIQVANIADLYFKTSLKARLSIVYVETWEDQDQAPGINKRKEITKAMEDFSAYVSRKLYDIEKDTTQLFTGRNLFKSAETTVASVGRICTGRSVGVSVDINPFEPHILASNLAHAIGHNLGFGHDDMPGAQDLSDPCTCTDWHGCIMKSSLSGEDGIQPYKFSECSYNQFQKTMEKGSALCILNRPSELGQYGTCGNGVIDDGEDCDCGSEASCESNPCCSPITCRLKLDAECSSGPCCDNCRIRPRGTQCRHAHSDCDLPEYCDGDTGDCPADLYVRNGEACVEEKVGPSGMANEGYCFNGECPTPSKQCMDLWGHGAEPGEPECFQHYNLKGTAQGNCGENKFKYGADSEFRKCGRQDVQCGTLHCQGGLDKPIVDGGVTHINMQGVVQGKHVECKIMTGGMDQQAGQADMGLVRDGAKCGDNRICLNQTCKDLGGTKSYTKCPQNNPEGGGMLQECSGQGKCSNINTCVCSPEFSGLDCSVRLAWQPSTEATPPSPMPPKSGHKDEGPTMSQATILKESDSDTVIMVIVLVVGVGFIFMLFAVMALCYRRKSALPKYEPPYLKRPMVPAKGYTHPPSPHPSQHLTPDHGLMPHYPGLPCDNDLSGQGKMHPYTPTPTYRSVDLQDHIREHGMKRMNHGGSLGSQHQLQAGLGSNQILGSGQNLMADYSQQEKGILKKPGPGGYCPAMDKDRWEDRLSSSSQNNLVNLSSGQQLPDRPDSRISRRTEISDVERTLKSLNGYHEDILEALRDAASTRSGVGGGPSGGHGGYPGLPEAPVLTEELKRHLAESRAVNDYRSQQELRQNSRQEEGGRHGDQDEMGPIRIRNLEDLIRQLEHSSNRHRSPSGSEDVRMSSETEADRHFSGRTPGAGPEVPHYGGPGRYLPHTTSSSGIARRRSGGGDSPALSLASAASSLNRLTSPGPSRRGSRHRSEGRDGASRHRSPLPSPPSPGKRYIGKELGVSEPGKAPPQDASDSEDYLRNKLLRSASEEGLNIPSTPEFSCDGNLSSSPFPVLDRGGSRALSPASPASETSSYQASMPGSARSEPDSYTTHSERSYPGPQQPKDRKYFSSGLPPESPGRPSTRAELEEALLRTGYFLPEYKH